MVGVSFGATGIGVSVGLAGVETARGVCATGAFVGISVVGVLVVSGFTGDGVGVNWAAGAHAASVMSAEAKSMARSIDIMFWRKKVTISMPLSISLFRRAICVPVAGLALGGFGVR